jgi:hypothetical protein
MFYDNVVDRDVGVLWMTSTMTAILVVDSAYVVRFVVGDLHFGESAGLFVLITQTNSIAGHINPRRETYNRNISIFGTMVKTFEHPNIYR